MIQTHRRREENQGMVIAWKGRVVNRETGEEEEAMVMMMTTHLHPQVGEAEVMIRTTPVGVGTPVRTEMTPSQKGSAVTGGQEQAVHQQAKTTTIPKTSRPKCQVHQRSGRERNSLPRTCRQERVEGSRRPHAASIPWSCRTKPSTRVRASTREYVTLQ